MPICLDRISKGKIGVYGSISNKWGLMKLLPETGVVAISVEAGAALHFDKVEVCLPLHDGWHGDLLCILCGESSMIRPACT